MGTLEVGWFFLGWLVINLLQAGLTGLLDDEAYYWVYSRFPEWGYFDHPPMIAVLIRAGYGLFQNELGLRLFIILMSTATLWMIWLLLEKKNNKLFYAITSSMFLLQIGGIIAVPDLPLLFFIALYFITLKRFIAKSSQVNGILLGLVIAAMMYSKYHGLLIILFTLMALPKLFTRPATYTAAIIATALYMPHILWQVRHGLPSVQYHLFERNASTYQFEFTLQYITGQVILAGPLIGWLILYAAFNQKPANELEKVLKWTTLGIFILFLVATLKGRSEANWTVPAFIGLIILAHQFLTDHPEKQKWIYRLWIPSILIIIIVRIYMMLDIHPQRWLKKDEFHKIAEWAKDIRDSAKGRPVVFANSYQRASQYWFYTGDASFSVNSIHYRRSNYNFWPLEQQLQGREVFVVYPDNFGVFPDTLPTARWPMHSRSVDSFFSHSSIQLEEFSNARVENGEIIANLWGRNTAPRSTARIYIALYAHDNDVAYILPTNMTLQVLNQGDYIGVAANIRNVKPGRYRYKWAIESCIPGWPTLNSTSREVEIPPTSSKP